MTEFDLDSIDAYTLSAQFKKEIVSKRTKRQEEDLQRFLEVYYA